MFRGLPWTKAFLSILVVALQFCLAVAGPLPLSFTLSSTLDYLTNAWILEFRFSVKSRRHGRMRCVH
jgi:hypothetical protein